MKDQKWLLSIMMATIFCLSSSFVLAQSETDNVAVEEVQTDQVDQVESILPDEAEVEDGGEYSYGTVKQASAEQITVLEYDYDGEQNVEMVYKTNTETKFENVTSATELAEGDSVEIYYDQVGEDKVATLIIKEIFDEEYTDDGLIPADSDIDAAPAVEDNSVE